VCWKNSTIGATMQRTAVSLAACALIVATAACADTSAVGPDIDARFADVVNPESPPPPPPVDTLAATVDDGSSSRTFDVTLFINRTETIAWVMFSGEGTTPEARLLIKSGTSLTGTGELTLQDGSTLVLSSATLQRSTLDTCSVASTEITVTEVTSRTGRCGNVVFTIGSKTVNVAVGVDRIVRVP
jgi:hypothetical protein